MSERIGGRLIRVKDLEKAMRKLGWERLDGRGKGSHLIFGKDGLRETFSCAHQNRHFVPLMYAVKFARRYNIPEEEFLHA